MFKYLCPTNIWLLFSVVFIVAVASDLHTAHASAPQDRLHKILRDSKIPPARLGLYVDAHDFKFDINADKLWIPASVTKVITAAAALEGFPVGHQFLTELKSDAAVAGKVLKGNLCLVGGGDAGFVSESMWFLVNEFHRTGIRHIEGDILVDDSYLDTIRFDESRDKTRVDRAYDAPIGAMTFNWSAVNIYVRPGDKENESALVWVDPENEFIRLTNTAKTVKSGKTNLQVSHVGRDKDGREKIAVSGRIALGAKEFVSYKAIEQPELWAGYNLKSFLQTRGVATKGLVRRSACASGARSLAMTKSKPVGELAQAMMKFSNNYIAEILTKNLGAHKNKKQGTMDLGMGAVRQYVSSLGIGGKEMEIFNPSGLSRKNKMTPIAVARVLGQMRDNFRHFPEFVSSFPIAGVDGTLKNRNQDLVTQGKIRAKTGHLTGVAALAGYVATRDEHIVPFVFFYNGSADETYAARKLFDNLTTELAK